VLHQEPTGRRGSSEVSVALCWLQCAQQAKDGAKIGTGHPLLFFLRKRKEAIAGKRNSSTTLI